MKYDSEYYKNLRIEQEKIVCRYKMSDGTCTRDPLLGIPSGCYPHGHCTCYDREDYSQCSSYSRKN